MSTHLGSFADLESALNFAPPERPKISGKDLLSIFGNLPAMPTDFKIEYGKSWDHDGVTIREISWSTGFGPRTEALLLKPAGTTSPLTRNRNSPSSPSNFWSARCIKSAGVIGSTYESLCNYCAQ